MRKQDLNQAEYMEQFKIYSSDISDLEWEWIEPILPRGKSVGRLRKVSIRAVLNAIFYRADNGVKWRNLPADFPAWQTVYGYFRWWVRLGVWERINTILVREVRWSQGRVEEPSLGIIDSQSVKLGQKGGRKLVLMVTKKSKDASGRLQWMCLV